MFVLPCDVSDALSPQGPRRPPRTSLDQTPRLDHICMASGVRTVTEHPGCPRPGCHSRREGQRPRASPSARSASIPLRWLWEKRMAQSSRPGERAASGLGSHSPREPPGRVTPGCFINIYIYIFFVARYCYLTLGLGLRGLLASPNQAWARQPPWGARQCPGVPTPHWGSPSRTSPAVALPVPVAVSTAKLFTLFSDVIFKTSDIACLLGHCWQ